MNIRDEYPNYHKAIQFVIGDKYPIKGSDDSKQISYAVALKNTKSGFDYYELNRTSLGVQFKIATMVGLRTIVSSQARIITSDLSEANWSNLIMDTSISHFNKEEYQALKMGYVQKTNTTGCMGLIILIATSSLILLTQIF